MQVLCNTGGLVEIPLRSLPTTVEHLSLTRNNFHIIRSDAFNGLKLLTKISLDGNNISTIKPFAFRGLPRLKELSIQHTPLTTVNQFAFAGLQNLSSILLGHNKIVQIEGYAFAGTNYLKAIMLNNNPIQKIMTNAFSGLTNVEHIGFPSGIRSIEPDSFSGLDYVGVIKLAFMDLPSLRPYTFRGMSHVHTLALQESDLGIIRIAAFDGLAYVDNLNIFNNKIDAVQELNIGYNNSIRVLRLHGNHLLEVPAPGVVTIEGVDILSVKNNHFPCDCRVHSLIEGPLGNASTGDFLTTNYCISPLEVHGHALADVNIDEIGRCHEHVTKGNLDSSKNGVPNGAVLKCVNAYLIIYFLIFSIVLRRL